MDSYQLRYSTGILFVVPLLLYQSMLLSDSRKMTFPYFQVPEWDFGNV